MRNKRIFINYIKKNHLKLIEIFIALFFVGIITNQIAQPLFFPRLSTFYSSKPLWVQSIIEENNEINYYKVFKVSYEIEPALFDQIPQKLKIRLPGESDTRFIFLQKIEFIGQIREAEPYIFIDIPSELESSGFIKTSDLDYELSIEIKTNGWKIKSFPLNLYFRQKIDDIDIKGGTSHHYRWWSDSIYPEPVVLDIYESNEIIYGLYKTDRDIYYSFKRITITNNNDFPIREYWYSLKYYTDLDTEPAPRVCEKKVELHTLSFENEQYLKIDLQPHETRDFIIFEQIKPENMINTKRAHQIDLNTLWCSEITKKIDNII